MSRFETATRKHYRYMSTKGDLTTEDLWDVPLTAKSPDFFSLDNIAQGIHEKIVGATEKSFVKTEAESRDTKALEAKLEIVKFVIAYKLDAAERAVKRVEAAARKQRILELMQKKDEEDLEGKNRKELEKLLKAEEKALTAAEDDE